LFFDLIFCAHHRDDDTNETKRKGHRCIVVTRLSRVTQKSTENRCVMIYTIRLSTLPL
jgi:uncharacterized protein with PIN domain